MTQFAHANRVIEEVAIAASSVLVSFSAGKDSLVTLDLCHRGGLKCTPFFMYFVPGISFVESVIAWAEDRYGVKVLQVPHPSRFQAQAIEADMRGGEQIRIPMFVETWDSVKESTGLEWMGSGLKKVDSLHRRAMMSQFPLHAIDLNGKRFYPLAFWSDSLVLRYLKQNRIPVPFSAGGKSFGIGFHPVDLRPIRDRFPEDYRKIVKEFPFAETMIMHEEMYGHDE